MLRNDDSKRVIARTAPTFRSTDTFTRLTVAEALTLDLARVLDQVAARASRNSSLEGSNCVRSVSATPSSTISDGSMRPEDRPEWLVEIVTVLRLGRVQVGRGEVARVLQTVAAGVDIAPVYGHVGQLRAGLDVEQEDQSLHQYYSLRT